MQALQATRGIIRTLDPLYPVLMRQPMRAQLLQLSDVLDTSRGIPDAVLGDLWATVGAGMMMLENFSEAAAAFRRADDLQPDQSHQVRLAWCLREVSSRSPDPMTRRASIEEAQALLQPIAALPWTGDDAEDFQIALARNRLATLPMQPTQKDRMAASQRDLLAVAEFLQARPGMEPWLAPMNLANLGVSFAVQGRFEEALRYHQESEREFRARGLASHPELFYSLVGQSQALGELGRHQEASEAALRGLEFRREHGLGYTEATLSFQLETANALLSNGRTPEAQELIRDLEERLSSPLVEGEMPERSRLQLTEVLREITRQVAGSSAQLIR